MLKQVNVLKHTSNMLNMLTTCLDIVAMFKNIIQFNWLWIKSSKLKLPKPTHLTDNCLIIEGVCSPGRRLCVYPTPTRLALLTLAWRERQCDHLQSVTLVSFNRIMWPWSTEAVLSRWGIFVAIANNTLYGSKWSFFFNAKNH